MSEELTLDDFNAGNEIAVARFNTEMQAQVEQYNANIGTQIEHSNVQRRRHLNTINTAAINAAIQMNAQNDKKND